MFCSQCRELKTACRDSSRTYAELVRQFKDGIHLPITAEFQALSRELVEARTHWRKRRKEFDLHQREHGVGQKGPATSLTGALTIRRPIKTPKPISSVAASDSAQAKPKK
jgi:hypothetical protein